MYKRKRMKKRASRRLFSKTSRPHKKNVRRVLSRGGVRL